MIWTIIYSKDAQKQLDKLSKDARKRIILKLDEVEKSPFSYLERLQKSKFFKLRVGDYRILIEVINDKLILYLIKIAKRSRVYQ